MVVDPGHDPRPTQPLGDALAIDARRHRICGIPCGRARDGKRLLGRVPDANRDVRFAAHAVAAGLTI
jgi:hypothetical protein